MGEEQQFCLRWNNFQANITSQFESLRDEEDFVDVTLACEGQQLKAHKVVLSACSPYFKELFKSNPCKHPIIFMRDVEFKHLQCLLEFMYAGEVNVAQAQLPAFLRTAESLQIRGLTEAPRQKSESKQQPPPPSPLQTPSHGSPVQAHSTPKPPPRQTRSAISPPTLVPRPSLCLEGKQNSTANSHIDEGITPPAKRIKSDSECEAGLIISGSQDDMEHSRSSMPAERLDVEGKSNSPEVIQPKLELPEYNSDGESRADSMGGSTSLLGLDNSMDMHSSFAALQSGVDVIPGTSSQPSVGDLSLDSSQGRFLDRLQTDGSDMTSHTLAKPELLERRTRRRCKSCYFEARRQYSTQEAHRIVKKVLTYCRDCPKQPPLCVLCFNKLHNQSVELTK